MAQLEFKYASDQPHQLEAIQAVVDLFKGQQFIKSTFSTYTGRAGQAYIDEELLIGHGNDIRITPDQLLNNLHAIQEDNCLPLTEVITDGRLRDFTVEMETGTGKTYIYIRTIYELYLRYGLTKFVIVVPSVAIREGTIKSFQTTRSHFDNLYDHTPLDYFVYDPKNMGSVGNFATSSDIQVMIMNIDAFNKGLQEDGTFKENNLFHRNSEGLIGGRSPRELVSECKPIVIIDEPQSVDNTPKAKAAIKSLNPLFVLRYSATHRQPYNMVYRLTPVDAFERHLVKGICVDSISTKQNMNGAYVSLNSVKSDPYSARLTIDVRQPNASQKRKAVTAKVGSSLYDLSHENSDYEAGWIINNIGTAEGNEFVEFQNGEVLELNHIVNDMADEQVKNGQIRRTIEDHLERQFNLWPQHVKVLSLFFIDRVDRYRIYEPEVHGGIYAEMFEHEYKDLLNSKAPNHIARTAGVLGGTWKECYQAIGAPIVEDPSAVHQGYFAKDKKSGHIKDSRGDASSSDDAGAFELIMKKKETLISFPDGIDPDKNVSFIFSHSALKEGWDNPNVFQICTLVETKDTLTKRQKIGRGLRICVDQDGERLYDPDANILTVIANESYNEFAKGLQKEFETDNFKFGVLTPESFNKVMMTNDAGTEERFGYERSQQLYNYFMNAGMIDEKGTIKAELKSAAETDTVVLPEEFASIKDQIQFQVDEIILHKAQKLEIHDKAKEVAVELQKDVTMDPAFQELWDRIRQRTRFEVQVDSSELIKMSIDAIDKMEKIRPPQIMSERAGVSITEQGVIAEGTGTSLVNISTTTVYDLPDPIAELQDAVGLTRATLKAILEGCSRFDEYKIDPATFLEQVVAKITVVKNQLMSNGIKYVKLPEDEWYTMYDLELTDRTAYLEQNAWEPRYKQKCIYTYIILDSAGVERSFAEALDLQSEVLVYAKLPSSFKIDTPLGSYNPDWAYVEEDYGELRIYFVIETKGGKNGEPGLRSTESMKIECARKHFDALDLGDDFKYEVRTTYEPASSWV